MHPLERARLFVAVFPPAEVLSRLAVAARGLARRLSPNAVAWTRPEQIHLTLNFIGNVERARTAEFERAVAAVCRRGEPLLVRARGLGCFPGTVWPRIIWAGLDGAVDALAGLRRTLDESLGSLGYVADVRPFHPHLTIGRVKQLNGGNRRSLAENLPRWREAVFGSWTVERVDLMQSVLSPAGAEYAPVQSFPLRPQSKTVSGDESQQ